MEKPIKSMENMRKTWFLRPQLVLLKFQNKIPNKLVKKPGPDKKLPPG